MMNNLIILPLLIPLGAGLMTAIFRKNILFQRIISILAVLLTCAASFFLISQVSSQGIQTLQLGGWPAPYGITFALDMFAALLILTASFVSLACLLFAIPSIGQERERYYFYPLYQFLMVGVNGSFLTGDLFNLFVCFEVMLLASYVLLSLGGTKPQLRESIKYILINTISSSLFLIAIAYLYRITGTVNMAHLSVLIAQAGQDGLITTVSLLFIIVFSLKAGLLLFFWLPGSYSTPPAAVRAVFGALLTKVGIYAIFRVFSLIFYHQPETTHLILGVMALLTMLLGGMGAMAYWDIHKILSYNVIISVGFIIAGFTAFSMEAIIGAIYYLMHDMIVKALLFLIGGAMIGITGTSKLKEMSGLIRYHPLLGWMFFIGAMALGGIPPLSGFIGKLIITQGILEKGALDPFFYALAAAGLLSSLMSLYSVVKIFTNGFWGETLLSKDMEKISTKGLIFPCVLLTAISIFLGLGGEVLYPYLAAAAETLLNPQIYIEAVLK
ncbi:Na+/H+ antiporter subunit D [Dehalobacterium formicoaceticum]